MENLTLISSPKSVLLGNCSRKHITRDISRARRRPFSFGRTRTTPRYPSCSVYALSRSHVSEDSTKPQQNPHSAREKLGVKCFASISSLSGQETSSVGVNPQLAVPPPPSQVGSPLFWIGVGVGLSALFSWVATKFKNYAMQQTFKTMMGQMSSQNNQFNNAGFSPGSPYPFPMPSPPAQPGSSHPGVSQSAVTVDIPATKVEAAPAPDVKYETEVKKDPKRIAFVDVSPGETQQKSPFESFDDVTETGTSKEVSQNGAASKEGGSSSDGSQFTRKSSSVLSVEALEKMMEDPSVQKMVYPYLPEEMRNPTTFKWMLQNLQYRQQLEDMLNNMSGSNEWDNHMMDSLKNFDLSSPDVKQQFDQIGLTPEEVISKIMANPEVAMAFQNPRVQAAIMECSQNPLSIAKYQNDKEVMDVFNKISELFPGVTGSP
ncbi:Protein TIC 40, chloroplastic [Quillaja saponaria]|uniref:Protein TIC 40, chloroplastic n=1 Tax=Quillaja saponaria TaxID=32244 RepID=A0AAD7PLA7_QUISA|nr:Protein TIC 40, chloroplastic [Quillaja saponaria]KAJ7959982.1 Protein TIC 40, chloroplastic [Quillaja saponaria]